MQERLSRGIEGQLHLLYLKHWVAQYKQYTLPEANYSMLMPAFLDGVAILAQVKLLMAIL